ncbi:L-2-hydroxyglutarate oxidase [Enterovibrio sp. ZSDZ35]|uniref:L-2-hydroxyglutarate oxidase n=1 Tax=Enterovibrio qingdaonensis TaxID=2899818 RepID=A0ABT5QTI1_9GAMM|nr:L-2-hydroxyglutarate oxidase [Enterovibrio sp. ZSDZ35]MDD1784285.1 L-2-hydroxyglutarate oxidase [Enterovibrio sp. ZSDZ35]
MIRSDYLVIGAGIVGLSVARELQQRQPHAHIVVVDKEQSVANHQTGRNSGVIHAGIYYTPNSLKARFCKEGNLAIKAFCEQHDIPYEECGKLLVATSNVELSRMDALKKRATENGLEFEVLSAQELKSKEPNINGLGAIFVPSTGIVNYRQICEKLETLLKEQGGEVLFDSPVEYMKETTDGVTVVAGDHTIHANHVIACAGVMSDRIVRLLGEQPTFNIIPFRGDYYQLSDEHNGIINSLIYPIPDPSMPFLGVHLTKMIDGSVTVGPNAVLSLAREGYHRFSFSPKDTSEMLQYSGFYKVIGKHFKSAMKEIRNGLWKGGYLKEVQKYCPSLTADDLQGYPSGIRAQAVYPNGDMVDDFLFHQTSRTLVVCNAPSPAATSCFPIARYIVDKVL